MYIGRDNAGCAIAADVFCIREFSNARRFGRANCSAIFANVSVAYTSGTKPCFDIAANVSMCIRGGHVHRPSFAISADVFVGYEFSNALCFGTTPCFAISAHVFVGYMSGTTPCLAMSTNVSVVYTSWTNRCFIISTSSTTPSVVSRS